MTHVVMWRTQHESAAMRIARAHAREAISIQLIEVSFEFLIVFISTTFRPWPPATFLVLFVGSVSVSAVELVVIKTIIAITIVRKTSDLINLAIFARFPSDSMSQQLMVVFFNALWEVRVAVLGG